MKTKFNFLAALAFTVALSFTASAQKRNITLKELPAQAQTFLAKHFPNQASSYIIEDKGYINTDYKVMLTGGTEIEFDGKGNLDEADGNKKAIPLSILPKPIAAYITANYKGQEVEKFEKEKWGYKVEFLNDLELKFDSAGKFIGIDD
ncbi:PepSY-like domain-containing protein [Flavobacterium sp. DG1-102-2]|uniref:PepSY-like domain-containing protein n=1 Tax=Flavobacterium sp. DG1-102-2 TaxID=3081663 RepID=UPI0029497AD5|nr:PepSY-like domain-containing protein [Flavobacterium sp. DG1-102-2]MDV6167975.1 PepSY-like domain-containing protein [Flavobacterium sp. DG1-102-2]